ncbi:rod shape-determining protein MreC [Sulfobacillus harzensis]|uniref:Cell shape-determining protein MreC n=1 Tax=Sulfobacillus harzensis TaxID=2729629 RepID=A0A7Y0Q2K1_9FIRM|nr:rod shape-determining protein MreC [Sulfobacillus harzensis]NMP21244.1 rod shape-determining protein MreC [Sulfobacillus harzensis]
MGGFIYRWRRPIIIVLVIMVVSLSLSFTARVHGKVVALSNLIGTVVSPASSSLTYLGDKVGQGVGTVGQLFTLEQENVQLKQKLLLYNSMKLELSELSNQNSQLRGLLDLKESAQGWKLQAASVISRNPDNWFQTVVINQGSRSGIQPGMAVIVPQGVVGRVVSTTPVTATVMLILDPSSGVGAQDVRSQAAGVINGRDPVTGNLTFQLFAHRPNIQPGDAVVTSGYSQYYPPGLLIGQVEQVQKTAYGLTETAVVTPSVNFNQLDNVMVVLSHPNGTSLPPIYGGNH